MGLSGPSPRARGIRSAGGAARPALRSIPASAGNPRLSSSFGRTAGVHPRERGESRSASGLSSCGAGPSPRARGIPLQRGERDGRIRSIPASAGNPGKERFEPRSLQVHPRERGESRTFRSLKAASEGPSPRARGIRGVRAQTGVELGSIPASAGNPGAGFFFWRRTGVHPRERGESAPPPASPATSTRVHPRERGESMLIPDTSPDSTGPSPRARGIRVRQPRPRGALGSIPASAGNPQSNMFRSASLWVHPRERGESQTPGVRHFPCRGPSPRARGIRGRVFSFGAERGSIPASAGNPAAPAASTAISRVHPRERGESTAASVSRSPGRRSIPASAGNPAALCRSASRRWVHPRERGESHRRRRALDLFQGPSPRARGIPARQAPPAENPGPSPRARGILMADARGGAMDRVHPRERGESLERGRGRWSTGGPSPRARGIRGRCAGTEPAAGSIPASAGNPGRCGPGRSWTWVHPRERGESPHLQPPAAADRGPSPRARGILSGLRAGAGASGSIPASAGNPARC